MLIFCAIWAELVFSDTSFVLTIKYKQTISQSINLVSLSPSVDWIVTPNADCPMTQFVDLRLHEHGLVHDLV